MSTLQEVKKIAQVDTGFEKFDGDTKLINRYLKHGWTILDISKRGYDNTDIGEEAEFCTVFVLGHVDINAVDPAKEDQKKLEDLYAKMRQSSPQQEQNHE